MDKGGGWVGGRGVRWGGGGRRERDSQRGVCERGWGGSLVVRVKRRGGVIHRGRGELIRGAGPLASFGPFASFPFLMGGVSL